MANNQKRYASDSTISAIIDNIKNLFVKKTDLEETLLGYDTKGSASAVQDNLDAVSSQVDSKASIKIITWGEEN